LASVLAFPAAGHAATNFGSRLNHDPANSGECQSLMNPCTLASYIHPSDPSGDPYSGGAPVDGVITKFRIRALGKDGMQPAKVTFRTVQFTSVTKQSGPDSALAKSAGTGPTVMIPGVPDANDNTPITEYPGRVPVKAGDHLAIDTQDAQATYNSSGDEYTFLYSPTLVAGAGSRASTDSTGELLIAATIEADRDHDGYGDETQDKCPSQAGTAGECDRTGPTVKHIRITSHKYIRFTLSEKSSAKVTLSKKIRGHYRTIKRATKSGVAGANKVTLHHRLSAGKYRVLVVATDRAGNQSKKFSKEVRLSVF
jgi:hypothetical protein